MDTNFLKDSFSKSPLFGSGGDGKDFNDDPDNNKGLLYPTSIIIRKGRIIDNITFKYSNTSIEHGGTGGTSYEAKLNQNEYIVKVAGKYGEMDNQMFIETLVFTTNEERNIVLFGQIPDKKDFEYIAKEGHAIYALYGNAGKYLNSIGFHTIKKGLSIPGM